MKGRLKDRLDELEGLRWPEKPIELDDDGDRPPQFLVEAAMEFVGRDGKYATQEEARQMLRGKPDPDARPSGFEIMAFEFAIRALDPAKAREQVREMRTWHGDGYVDALLEGLDPALRERLTRRRARRMKE